MAKSDERKAEHLGAMIDLYEHELHVIGEMLTVAGVPVEVSGVDLLPHRRVCWLIEQYLEFKPTAGG